MNTWFGRALTRIGRADFAARLLSILCWTVYLIVTIFGTPGPGQKRLKFAAIGGALIFTIASLLLTARRVLAPVRKR